MKKRKCGLLFPLIISLSLVACGSNNEEKEKIDEEFKEEQPKEEDNLSLLYFGKPIDDYQQEDSAGPIPYSAPLKDGNKVNECQTFEINYGDTFAVQAIVKNTNRLSFVDIVLSSASTGKKYVFNEGNGEYLVSTSTVYSDGIWTTEILFGGLNWSVVNKETNKCFFDTFLEIDEINFLDLKGELAKAVIANTNIKRIDIHAIDTNDAVHSWSPWQVFEETCEEQEHRTHTCNQCGFSVTEFSDSSIPTGHNYDGDWIIETATEGILKPTDYIVGTHKCSKCNQVPRLQATNFNTKMNLKIL